MTHDTAARGRTQLLEYTCSVTTAPGAVPAGTDTLEDMLAYLERSPGVAGPVLSADATGAVALVCQVHGYGAVLAVQQAWQWLLDAMAAAQVSTRGVQADVLDVRPYTAD